MIKALVSILIGSVMGFLGSRYLFVGSALSLVPWGIMGLVLGAWNSRRGAAMANGALYGFSLAFVFMIAGYTGTEPLFSRLPFFALLGAFGAISGLVLEIGGYGLKVSLRKVRKAA
jgi:hypothetical protein